MKTLKFPTVLANPEFRPINVFLLPEVFATPALFPVSYTHLRAHGPY